VKLEAKYRKQASDSFRIKESGTSGSVAWRSPANLAIIKYWGKKDFQLPQNPSLSFTLKSSFTDTLIEYRFKKAKGIDAEFLFGGSPNPEFGSRIYSFLVTLSEYMPFIPQLKLKINSRNSFPHSSGIASSASAMSSIVFCMSSIEKEIFGTLADDVDFYKKASFLARLGSGSACRSVYGEWSVWGKNESIKGSSDEIAVPLNTGIDDAFRHLSDAIEIVDSAKKKMSSSEGHRTMVDHPFAGQRYHHAKQNFASLVKAIQLGDTKSFASVAEIEALSLHAMMLTSKAGYSLLKDATWQVIDKIRKYRAESGIFMSFTLDAGPNVHLLYSKHDADNVRHFISSELPEFLEKGNWIDDGVGSGPVMLQ